MDSSGRLERSAAPCYIAFLVLVLVSASPAAAQTSEFTARLTGFDQVPPILTDARASLKLEIDPDARRADFRLKYEGLEGQPIVATINFGQPSVNGAPIVILCFSAIFIPPSGSPPGPIPVIPVPACPGEPNGAVAGSFDERRVFTAPSQGVDFNDFDALVQVLRSGRAYVALTSLGFPSGELRGQIDQLSR